MRRRQQQQQQQQQRQHTSSSSEPQGRDWFPFSSRSQGYSSHEEQTIYQGISGSESFQSLKLLWGGLLIALWVGLWLNQRYFSQLSIILLLVLSFFFVVHISSVNEVVIVFRYIFTSIAMIFGYRPHSSSYYEHRRTWDSSSPSSSSSSSSLPPDTTTPHMGRETSSSQQTGPIRRNNAATNLPHSG